MPKANSKHRNQVRIIGGEHRGRKIGFPDAEGLRPTADSVRERLFNWLGQDLTGLRVLDAFAGSGVMGMEAASRHAASVVAVEMHKPAVQSIRANMALLRLENVEIVSGDVLKWLACSGQKFDVVFLDPPYAWQNWTELFSVLMPRLADNARIYIEAAQLPKLPENWRILRNGQSGKSRFVLCEAA